MNIECAKKQAEAVVKNVVNCLAEKQYNKIQEFAEMKDLSSELLKELIDDFLECNELPYIDKYGVKCNFTPQYEYHQLSYYFFNDNSGFSIDYDLTTDNEINDLTLQMKFLYTNKDELKAIFEDVHIL